ncbi:hypothetical protein ABB37_05140 [Leptomonas pyrrhocoris]|uniref:Uncharacterized protein n=1 Tax=Leptomonas pyrrhocoris TaxID=157538 RepID=A0A0N0DVI9_LEPPY|nr:hypothetical protein ABB37_05140 [Leptomonas pyrrhocoris]KPA80154.1 hypothetical protein ABB37_05140 [Leptomonas pyrrhocoris]|eukprot:XP_015658593.1 hypothetical protein ABB37_05140 [Leptomonas pyrrhocoris]
MMRKEVRCHENATVVAVACLTLARAKFQLYRRPDATDPLPQISVNRPRRRRVEDPEKQSLACSITRRTGEDACDPVVVAKEGDIQCAVRHQAGFDLPLEGRDSGVGEGVKDTTWRKVG